MRTATRPEASAGRRARTSRRRTPDVRREHRRSRAPARDLEWKRTSPDNSEQEHHTIDDVEVPQVAQGRLHVGLAGHVRDEDEPGLVAEALLLHRADRHAVPAE